MVAVVAVVAADATNPMPARNPTETVTQAKGRRWLLLLALRAREDYSAIALDVFAVAPIFL